MDETRPESVSVLMNGEAFEVHTGAEPPEVDMTEEEFKGYIEELNKTGEGNNLKATISGAICEAVDEYYSPKPEDIFMKAKACFWLSRRGLSEKWAITAHNQR